MSTVLSRRSTRRSTSTSTTTQRERLVVDPAVTDIPVVAGSVTALLGADATDTVDLLAVLAAPGAFPGRFTVVNRRSGLRSRSLTLQTLAAPPVVPGRFTTVASFLRRAAQTTGSRQPGFGAADILVRLGLEPYARQHLSGLSGDVRRLVEIGAAVVAGVGHRIVLDLRLDSLDAVAVRRVMELLADATKACTAVLVATDDIGWADAVAAHVVVVAAGEVVAQGHPATIAQRRQGISTVSWIGPDGLHEHRTRAPGAVVAELELHFGLEVHSIAVVPPSLGDVVADLLNAHGE
ncbi:ABC-type multidrug transport system ATPase subunit [Nakamurella sp. UYEF19]|uniref:hypothetical protein n=1 Tax=Nakamurella sp. UYEF19 TaxID=1756392 RepID=UPI00339B0B75